MAPKKMCLEVLIEKIGVEEQVRLKDEAINKIDISRAGDHSFVIGLERAIELDNLCGLAWFNLGIERSRSDKHVEAAFCFVVCGLVQKEDIEAWVNATLCCLNKEICVHILFLVIRTAYSFNREDYLTKLHKDLIDRFEGDILEVFTDMIDSALPEEGNGIKRPEVRLLHDDGIFRDIFTEANIQQDSEENT